MDDIAFSDWPGQPVDLSSSNPWLPAYGYQPPSTLLDKDDFIGNPALFLHGSSGPHYVFLETIMEETSDDLRSESDRSGSRASPVGWLATDSESGSVIHVDLNEIDEIDSGSESEIACPAKRRRQDPNLLAIPVMYSDTDSNHSLSRSSSLLQFENLEKSCQEGYSSSPSILSLYSQDSLEQQRKTNDLSPDSLERCHSDSESESDYYKTLKIDVPKSKRYRDSLFYTTKRLSDSDSKSDSDSQDSDETLQVASRSNSCKSVQNLKACRSFDSLNVTTKGSCLNNKKDKMSAENLSEDSGYSDHLCNYMKNKSSSIPNMQVQGIIIPEKSTNKVPNELKKVNARTLEDMNSFRLKNIKVEGFDAYDGEPCFQNFASHFGSSYQDLTMFDRYETLTSSFRPTLIDRFMLVSKRSGGNTVNPDCRVPQTDVLNIGSPVECVATSKINNSTTVTASASEPNLFQPAVDADSSIAATTRSCCLLDKTQVRHCKQDYFEASVCVSSVPKDLNLAGESKQFEEYTWSFNTTSIAAKNWDLADLPAETNLDFTDNFDGNAILSEHIENKMDANVYRQESSDVTSEIKHLTEDFENKMAASTYRQEGSNVIASIRQEESSSLSSGGSDISMPRYRREGSYVKAISDYLDVTDEEQEKSYQDPLDTILDIETQVQKAISESSIQSFNNDQEKLDMFFHSTPINKRTVTSTPNLSSLNCEKQLFDVIQTNNEIRRSMQNMPRKSSLIDRSASTSGMSDEDKTLTSKNFNGSGSTAKGVHFCPIVSEVSWKDSSSSEDMSSFSVSSDPHESTPESEEELPRAFQTPVRKSSSQPELPKAGENETDFIFIPLNPQKWASSTPSVATTRLNQNGNATKTDRGTSMTITIKLKNHDGGADVYKSPPTGRHVNQQQQQCSSNSNSVVELQPVPAPFHQQPMQQQAVAVMDSPIAHRPVIPPAKQTRTAKLGGFLSRFASFRFSTRKSSEAKDKKKNESKRKTGEVNIVKLAEPQTPSKVATEKDYIYIPLKGPLPPGFSSGQADLNGGRKHIAATTTTTTTKVLVDGREVTDGEFVKVNGSSRPYRDHAKERLDAGVACISAKPPLPKLPPRVVSACVKKRTEAAHSVPHSPSAALRTLRDIDSGVGGAPRNASSMEPMGLIETDLDTEVTVITGGTGAHVKTRSLMNLGGAEPPPQGRRQLLTATENANRPHKSMEFLLDKQNLKAVEPPENELQKGTGERVMSEHQLRVQRSLQKLTVPDWYKHNQVPREGFILKKQRNEPRWTGIGTANNSKTPSLSSLGSGHSPVLLSPTPHGQTQPFTRWSTSKLNSAASSPCASTRSSFNHRTSNGGISPCSVRSSFSYRQPYLGWRSQERLTRPRTPAERLATSLLPAVPVDNVENPEIQTSIKEVTSAIVHYVSGLKPDIHDRNSLSPTSSPRLGRDSVSPRFKGYESQDTASQRSASPQSRGSQKLCWLESSFVGTRPLDSPQTPVSLTSEAANQQTPPATLRLDLQKNINNGESLRA